MCNSTITKTDSFPQKDTVSAVLSVLGCSPYHFDCDLSTFTNWTFCKPPASDALDGYPSTRVTLRLSILRHNHSSVGILTLILPKVCCLGAWKELSSVEEDGVFMSGTWVHPMPSTVSQYVCSSKRAYSVFAVVRS